IIEEESASSEDKEIKEEEIINNEEDLTEEDKAMYEGYLDKVDSSSENGLSEEEKEMYNSYLNNEDNKESEKEIIEEESASSEDKEIKEEEIINNEEDLTEEDKDKYKYYLNKFEDKVNEEELEDLVYINNVQLDEIKDSDLNMLENIIKGDEEEGAELIRIDDNPNWEENIKAKSVENFDSMDELFKKETNMSEEKELETIEKENLDSAVEIEEEFSLGDDNGPILMEDENHKSRDDDDFDGEITQSDLDYAIKLFESEEASENLSEYSSKQDILLSENEINKFKKLFGYFKNIVEKMSPEDLNDFSKTEFYDMYSSLFRKFND
ncbi:hypothetical protein, partial [uncultured Brachyspira sp.]|uniref:hypothetical protein n=1 Tax=uncultured Brachyspira sp. TaxID=221953 RepID=UPI002624A441